MKPYYEADGITIYHGDCRDVLPSLGRFDLALTDPPYGAEWEYGGDYGDTFTEWMELIDAVLPMMRSQCSAVILPTSKIEGQAHIWKNHTPDWSLCWYKGALSTRGFVGFKDWEPVFVWGRSWTTPIHDHFHVPPEPFGSWGHPCPKPIKWAMWLLSRCSEHGHLIIDPFTGSGTTLRAAKDLGRRAVGVEREERFCEIAARRLDQGVLDMGAA